MNYFNIDCLIVYGYLFLTLFVGLFVGRNTKTIRDYAIADKSYGTPILILTLLATIMGGTSTIGITEAIFKDGIIMMIATSGYILGYLFIARYIAPRMANYKDKLSAGEIMHSMYGDFGQIITGFLGFLFCIAIVAAQCRAIGYTFNSIFGIDNNLGIIIGGAVLVIYSSLGGMRAVTITDVIQFAILIVMIPLIANVAVEEAGGIMRVLSSIPDTHLKVIDHEKSLEYLNTWMIWGVFPAFLMSPAIIQRMLMTKDKTQISKMFYVGAIFTAPFEIMVMLIAFVALITYPYISPSLAFPHVINDMMPPIFRGLAVAGILAVIMSTADSFLHVAGICIVHDVVKKLIKTDISKNEVFITRITTLLIGVLAILGAMHASSILEIETLAVSAWGPILVIPLVAGILGFRITSNKFIILILSTVTAYIIFDQLLFSNEYAYFATLCTIIINGLIFVIFYKISHPNIKKGEPLKLDLPNQFVKNFLEFDMLVWSKKHIDSFGANYMTFGIFCALNYILPYFMWTTEAEDNYFLMLMLRLIAGLLCVILILKDYWPQSFKTYFPLYWYFTLIYCLPFVTTVMILLVGAGKGWLINMALSIFLLSLLVNSTMFIFITFLGVILGYVFFEVFLGKFDANIEFKTVYEMIYIAVFASLIGLLFGRQKELRHEEKLENMRLFGGAIAHEVKNPLASCKMVAEVLHNISAEHSRDFKESNNSVLVKMPKDEFDMMFNQVPFLLLNAVSRGMKVVDSLLMSLKSRINDDEFAIFSAAKITKDALNDMYLDTKEDNRIELVVHDDFRFYGSDHFLKHVIFNLVNNSFKYSGSKEKIIITISNNTIKVRDSGIGIDKKDLPYVFERFYTTSKSGTGIGLSFCKTVMESFEGEISCDSVKGKFTEVTLIFPKVFEEGIA